MRECISSLGSTEWSSPVGAERWWFIVDRSFRRARVSTGDRMLRDIAVSTPAVSVRDIPLLTLSKAFVLSFSEALWAECRERGVHVVALCPGAVETSFIEALGNDTVRQTPVFSATLRPEEVADQGDRCIARQSADAHCGSQVLVPRAISTRRTSKCCGVYQRASVTAGEQRVTTSPGGRRPILEVGSSPRDRRGGRLREREFPHQRLSLAAYRPSVRGCAGCGGRG